jgi:hypothetical protein
MSAYQRRRVIAVWLMSIIMAIALAIALINTKVAVGPTTNWQGVITPGPEASAIFLALVPIVVALLWTGLAWFRGAFDDKTTSSTKNIESAPIPYKMALLLEMMDEDEREAFKQQLKRDILASETGYGDFDRLVLEETEKRKRG